MKNNPFEFDYSNLYNFATLKSRNYQRKKPFPHIIIDNFLNSNIYEKISKSFPSSSSEIWKTPTNIHTVGKSVTKQGPFGVKEYLYNEIMRRFIYELNSALFLNFLDACSNAHPQ